MKKLICFLAVLVMAIQSFAQKKTVVADTLKAKNAIQVNSGQSINEFSIDGTFGGNSDFALPTEKAVATFVGSNSSAAVILSRLLTVDGAGSGLDADLLDGQSSAYYLNLSANHTGNLPVANLAFGTANQLLRTNAGGTAAEWFTASYLTGTVGIANGGTNITTYTTGDLLYASATNVLSKLAVGTNGHVLTLAAGVPTWAAATGGITGSGTAGSLPKWATSSSLSNSVLQEDGSGRIGISTVPAKKVHILSTSEQLRLAYDGANYADFYLNPSGYLNITAIGNRYGFGISPTSFMHGSSDQNATTAFSLNNATAGTASNVRIEVISDAARFRMVQYSSLWTSSGLTGASRSFFEGTGSGGVMIGASDAAGTVGFFTGGLGGINLRMTIFSGGNVSIGNSTDAERLNVTGNILLSGVIKNSDGTAAAPSYTFNNDLDVGLYRPTTNALAVTVAGTEVVSWSAGQESNVLGSVTAPSYTFTGDLNNGWWSKSADVQAWSTGGTERMSLSSSGLTLGLAGTTLGALNLSGNTSGLVTLQAAAAAGTWSLTLPTNGGTNGYALTTNGTGVTTWTAVGTIAGTATSGQVAYGSGSNTLTSHSLFLYNGSNFSVGTIGNNYKGNFGSTSHAFVAAITSGAAFNAGVVFENSGDANNSWMQYRDGDGTFVMAHSTSQPFASETRTYEALAEKWSFKTNVVNHENISATTASGLTAVNGDIIYVNTTNGTFTSIGFWGRENGVWVKL